ncbi:MAG: hypothetical protein ACRDO2_04055, partial [Nocardioidaceae bacterium]
MRWDDLFADLEGQARALAAEEEQAEVEDRIRGETAQIALVNRLRAAAGKDVAVTLVGGTSLTGLVRRVGPDFVLVESTEQGTAGAVDHMVLTAAVLAWADLGPAAVSPESVGTVESRLGLSAALRGVAADRSRVTLLLRDGSGRHGTVARVGRDWLDLAV